MSYFKKYFRCKAISGNWETHDLMPFDYIFIPASYVIRVVLFPVLYPVFY